jgi:hypothetical protein
VVAAAIVEATAANRMLLRPLSPAGSSTDSVPSSFFSRAIFAT